VALKIAVIGAGSVGFTRRLMRDILSVPELQDTHFALTDISRPNLDLVTQLCQKDIRTNKLPARVSSTTDRRRAFRDADYVICCVRVGGLDAFKLDVEIPLKYGVDQCVGDTICAGGIMYAQRTIPQMLAFGDDILEGAKPGALLLEYANPMAMNCWALLDHGVNVVGLCHGIEHGELLAQNAVQIGGAVAEQFQFVFELFHDQLLHPVEIRQLPTSVVS